MFRKYFKKLLGFFAILIIAWTKWIPNRLDPILLQKAEDAYQKYAQYFPNLSYAILVDYRKAIFRKRLWIVDWKTKKVVMNTHVSHALNSGLIWAKRFSNQEGSEISSKGVFKTLNSYESSFGKGEYKIGMRLQGLEKGINDQVKRRSIVFHSHHSLWSAGCFMTPPKTNKRIIEGAKDGNMLLVVGDELIGNG